MPLLAGHAIAALFVFLGCLPISAQSPQNEAKALFPVEENGRWGYIGRLGKIVIRPQFQEALSFSEGLAGVEVDGKWGFIDETGKLVIEPRFSGAYEFSEGLARVQVGGDKYRLYGKWGFIDHTGRMVIEPEYGELTGVGDPAYGFQEGLAMIEVNYEKGFIDKTGKVIIAPEFQFAYHFTEGLACVSIGLDQKWGYIDKSGLWVIPPRFDDASLFSEGLAPVTLKGVCGFTDRSGNLKLIPKFKSPPTDCAVTSGHFNDGLSRWQIEGKYGYIDKSGNVAIPPDFDLTDHFSEGMAYIEKEGRYGFVDSSGKMAIEPQFYSARSFENGLARVTYGARDSWSYIDKSGTSVWRASPIKPADSETLSFIQTGHARDLLFVGWNSDGNLLASYSAADGWIKIWNPGNGQSLWSVKATELKPGNSLTSPDGLFLASGVRDDFYEIRAAKTGNVIWRIKAHSTSDERLTSPDGGTVADRGRYGDASVRLHDAKSNALIRRLEGHPGIVFAIAFSPDGNIVASGSGDRTIRFWDAQTGKLLKTLVGHTLEVTSVAFSSDGSTLVSGSKDDTIRIWDVAGGHLIRTIAGFTPGVDGIKSVAFSPNGQMVVAAGGEQVKLLETASGNLLRSFETHESHSSVGSHGVETTWCCGSEARSAAFSPDGSMIVSGHEDGTIKLWDVRLGTLLRVMKSRGDDVRAVSFSPDGRLIASSAHHERGRIELWSVKTGKLVLRFGKDSAYDQSIGFSQDGKTVASGHMSDSVKLWDAKTGKLIRELAQPFSESDHVALSPDGNRVVSGGENQSILLWESTGQLVWNLIPIDRAAEKRAQQQAREDAKISAVKQVERERKIREADKKVTAWSKQVFIAFEHFGEPINPLEQHMMEKGDPQKSLKRESAAEADGIWLRLRNNSPLPISFHTDSFYLPRPNCGYMLGSGSTAGLCDGMEISIQYQIQEANGKTIPYGIDVSSVSILPPGASVLFSVPIVNLKNRRVIQINFTYLKEDDKHKLEDYGSAHRVRFRGPTQSGPHRKSFLTERRETA